MMVPALREEALTAVADALVEIDGNSIIASHRSADTFFPEADYDEAVFRLQALQARLGGRTPPPPPDKVANAIETFRGRLAQRRGAPVPDATKMPTTELREATSSYVGQAHQALAGNPYLSELAAVDNEFPSDDYGSAIAAMQTVQDRVGTAPPPMEMSRKALSSWGSAKVVNPAFASFNSYDPMTASAGW